MLVGLAVGSFWAIDLVGTPPPWLGRILVLVLSPLWFLGVYLMRMGTTLERLKAVAES